MYVMMFFQRKAKSFYRKYIIAQYMEFDYNFTLKDRILLQFSNNFKCFTHFFALC